MSLSRRPSSCVIPHCGGCWPPPSHHYWTRTLSLTIAVCDPSLCDLTWCRGNICKSSRARHTRRWSLTRRGNTVRSSPLLCAAVFRQKCSRSVKPSIAWLHETQVIRINSTLKCQCNVISGGCPSLSEVWVVMLTGSRSHVGAGASQASLDKLQPSRPGSGLQSSVTGDTDTGQWRQYSLPGVNTTRGQRLGDYEGVSGILNRF